MNINFNLKFLSLNWKISINKEQTQIAIIVMVLIITTISAYWGSRNALILLLGLIVGIAATLILLKQPSLMVIVVFILGMFVPFAGPGGINATVLAVALLIGLWISEMLIVKRKFQFISSRVLLPVVVLLIISIFALGMGQISFYKFVTQAPLDAQVGGFAIFVFSLGGMLATAHIIKEIKWLVITVWTFIVLGAVYVFGRALYLPMERIYVPQSAGSMFWTWLVALSFSQVVFNSKLKKNIRGLLLILVIATFFIAVVQAYDWKSGWLPPLVVVGVILALRFPRLALFCIPIFLIPSGAFLVHKLIASEEYSWGTRIDAWIIVLTISRVSPIFGLGFSNYYWYTPLFPIRGWKVSFNSHSQYVDLIAQVGILGLLCFLWIFFEVGRSCWRLVKKLPDGFARSYSYGVLAGICGTLFAAILVDWVLPFVYNIGLPGFRASILPWIFMGGLIAVDNIYDNTKADLDGGTYD